MYVRYFVLISKRMYLEQSGYGICRNTSVRIRDQILHVDIAGGNACGVRQSKVGKCSD